MSLTKLKQEKFLALPQKERWKINLKQAADFFIRP
ncbi:MAG: hypothetical protein PWQ06_922 [Anaerophaga sp.]|nr:hypothetical protein [Anaerophaga sp.]